MAYRRHIIAARNVDKSSFAEALSGEQIVDITEAGGWCWAMASVWTTNARDVLGALGNFEGPAFITTTEDGCRWWLHLHKMGRERFTTFHEFGLIGEELGEDDDAWEDIYGDEDEDDDESNYIEIGGQPPLPEKRLESLEVDDDFFAAYGDNDLAADSNDGDGSDRDVGQDDSSDDGDPSPLFELIADYEDFGAPLPERLLKELENVPAEAAFATFFTLHARYIADALDDFEVPHDRDEVMRILTGENVTEAEMDSDVGNLWRFLEHLGLGETFSRGLEDLVAEFDGDGDDDGGGEADHVTELLNSLDTMEGHAVAGGPAQVPCEECPMLHRVATALTGYADAVFHLDFDPESVSWPGDDTPSYIEISGRPDGADITLDGSNALLAPKARKRIGALLAALPDGARLTLGGVDKDPVYRFSGHVHEGQWHIDEASAALDAAEIADLLSLFRQAEARAPQTARDGAEADAIMDAATRDVTLHDDMPARDGLHLHSPSAGGATALAGLFFRLRFKHRWDTDAATKVMEDNFAEWKAIDTEMGASMALPATDTIVYAGAASRFLEPDYESPSVDVLMHDLATDTDDLDGQFEALGYSHLGVLVCERVGGGFLRCYANEAECTYGVAYIMPFGMHWQDFVSLLDDGTVLTTTGSQLESSIRSLRILVRISKASQLDGLHKEHLEGLERLLEHGPKATEIDASLIGIAKRIDDFLVRRLGPSNPQAAD